MSPQRKEIIVTVQTVAAAFTEWERRYREEPDRFMSEGAKLLKETPHTYGQACAPYFLDILAETSVVPRSEENNEGDTPAPDGIIGSSASAVAAHPH